MAFSVARQLFHAAMLCVSKQNDAYKSAEFIHAFPHPNGGVLVASSNGHVMFIGHDPCGKIDTYHQTVCLTDKKNGKKLLKQCEFASVICADNVAGFYATSVDGLDLMSDDEIVKTCADFVKIDRGNEAPLPVYRALNTVAENSSQECVVIAGQYLRLISKVANAIGSSSTIGIIITTGSDAEDNKSPHIVNFNNAEFYSFSAVMVVMGVGGSTMSNKQGLQFLSNVSGYDRSFQKAVDSGNLSTWRSWRPIDTAPEGVIVEVKMDDGTIHPDCHFAHDMSGEEQPPFSGWFIPAEGSGYIQIDAPMFWRELP